MQFGAIVCFSRNQAIALASIVMFLPGLAQSNAVDDLLPGHWLEIPNSKLESHDG